jgi:hypothetical protein
VYSKKENPRRDQARTRTREFIIHKGKTRPSQTNGAGEAQNDTKKMHYSISTSSGCSWRPQSVAAFMHCTHACRLQGSIQPRSLMHGQASRGNVALAAKPFCGRVSCVRPHKGFHPLATPPPPPNLRISRCSATRSAPAHPQQWQLPH